MAKNFQNHKTLATERFVASGGKMPNGRCTFPENFTLHVCREGVSGHFRCSNGLVNWLHYEVDSGRYIAFNTVAFDQHKLITHGDYQYTLFWDAERHLRLARRHLPTDEVQQIVFPNRISSPTNSHLNAVVGISPGDGRLHLQFFSATTRKPGNPCVQRTLGIARTKNLDGPWTVDPQPMVPIEEQIENSSFHYEESNETWFLFTNHIGIDHGEYTDAIWVYWSKDLNRCGIRRTRPWYWTAGMARGLRHASACPRWFASTTDWHCSTTPRAVTAPATCGGT